MGSETRAKVSECGRFFFCGAAGIQRHQVGHQAVGAKTRFKALGLLNSNIQLFARVRDV